jgi:hypothetical protein
MHHTGAELERGGDRRAMTTLPDVAGLRAKGAAVHRQLLAVAARRQLDVDHLAALIAHESGWNAQAENPYTHAIGLIQFMPATAALLGTSPEALRRMSELEQLAYVEAFFARVAPHRALAPRDIAMAAFLPSRIGAPDEDIAFSSGSIGYDQNKALDRDRDGIITLGEVRDDVDRMLAGGGRFEVAAADAPAGPTSSSSTPSGGGWFLALLGLGLLARKKIQAVIP